MPDPVSRAPVDALDALRYLVERCEREWRDQDKPVEMDLVMLAVAEVREKVPGV